MTFSEQITSQFQTLNLLMKILFKFSSSGAGGEEPNIVVVRMLKQDNKGNNVNATVMGGSTQGSGDIENKGTCTGGQGTSNTGNTRATVSAITEKSSAGGNVYKETSSTSVLTDIKELNDERRVMRVKSASFPAIASKSDLHKVNFPVFHIPTHGIPISGYTTFQQIDCYKVYFHFNQYIFNVKLMRDHLKDKPTRVCQGSTSEGPFPFYEEIPLIKNLMASLMLKCYDDYIPKASTNTNLPLTVSP